MRIILTITLVIVLFQGGYAQAPLGFNYQGIARESDGTPISDKEIAIRVSIIDGPQGNSEFEEVHFLTTNNFGLFTAIIGQGNGNNTLNSVNWAGGNLWLQIELDPDNSGNYLLMGSQQLMSVPYALFAQQSGAGLSPGYGVDINNGTISNVLPDRPITLTGKGNTSVTGTYPNFTIESAGSADGDADATNELQTLSKSGTIVTLSNGGGSFTDAVDDADNNASNEIQDLQLVGNNLTITNNGAASTINLTPYLDNTDTQLTETEVDAFVNNNGYITTEADGSVSNELQSISKSGTIVTLSNGGGSFTDAVDDADNNVTNEIQDLQLVGNNLKITNNGAASTINLTPYLDNTDDQILSVSTPAINPVLRQIDISGLSNSSISFSVADSDDDTSNEIQTLSLNVPTNDLQLTSGGTISLSSYLDNTDSQNLTSVLGQGADAGNIRITNLADPTLAQDAVTKKYVDASDGVLQASILANSTGVSTNATDITTNAAAISSETTSRGNADTALQNELDVSQTGVGLNADGTYSADATTNYISLATSFKNADKQLDTQINTNMASINTLTNRLDNTFAFQADFTVNELGMVTENQVVLTENLDGFNQIALNQVIIGATGLYLIVVDAERTNVDGNLTRLIIRVNATDHIIYVSAVAQNISRTLLLNLTVGDNLKLLDTTTGAQSTPLVGVIGGYKISD